ncbi:MAG: D-alanine--D-alanine ligase A [Bacteriovoracales bacterium]|nr:D-alanine--D-alanine ligase A [Bacteriovoracales bacterium]
MKKIILFNGGESEEHEITLLTNGFLKNVLASLDGYEIHEVMLSKTGEWLYLDKPCTITAQKTLETQGKTIPIDGALPFLHGYPGESGPLLALLELYKIPHLGPGHEGAVLSFNKISTKYWMEGLSIPVCPSLALRGLEDEDFERGASFLKEHDRLFVKASSQGSSKGCRLVSDRQALREALEEALSLSPYALLEKVLSARELEVSVYEYRGKLHASYPGEIIVPQGKFYNYEEKYSPQSQTKTVTRAPDLDEEVVERIRSYSLRAFQGLKLSDLARIDFFYCERDGIILNEINTFPGLTPISMFPKMLESEGPSFRDFLEDRLQALFRP